MIVILNEEDQKRLPVKSLYKASMVIVKREQELSFDVVKNRYGPEKEELSFSEAVQFLVYRGITELIPEFIW